MILSLSTFMQFFRFCAIGVLNTGIHWGVFFSFNILLYQPQSISNLAGFICAVIFSFFMNAKFTFDKKATTKRFVLFTAFMGIMSYIVGYCADRFQILPIITLVVFSSISMVCGFLYSKYIVFKE